MRCDNDTIILLGKVHHKAYTSCIFSYTVSQPIQGEYAKTQHYLVSTPKPQTVKTLTGGFPEKKLRGGSVIIFESNYEADIIHEIVALK
jgi:hypothetical protein